ncbi:MAG: serine/threonine-protein kinase [Holophagaceae bacterium]
MTLGPRTRLGRYEIVSLLGAGGMGEVWKARDTRLDRFVAVKVLPEHLAAHEESLLRFEREAKAIAALNHPNITAIFDVGHAGDTAFAVMELLEGESLRDRLQQEKVPQRLAVDLATQIATGLGAAHARGVVHRDVKPANLWITPEGRLKILDFGLAKQAEAPRGVSQSYLSTQALQHDAGPQTERGVVLGTVGYMSPEQVRGEAVDARSDLFSLGTVLFEMLTGRRAFARDSHSETVASILRDDPLDLVPASGRALPPGLQRIVAHCLEKQPAQRFQSAEDLAFALKSFASGLESSAPWAAGAPATPRPASRLPALLGAGAALALAAGLGWWARGEGGGAMPGFRRLTFVPGTIEAARFGSDGRTVFFSERVGGGRPELFVLDPRSPGPKPLGIRDALLLGVSPADELAFLRGPRLVSGATHAGTLVRVPGGGGAEREVQDQVSEAVWAGTGLATLRQDRHAEWRLDFPPGREILACDANTRTPGRLALSRDGRRLALVDADYGRGAADIVVYGEDGARTVLYTKLGDGSGATLTGLAWGPGATLWFTEVQGDQTTLWSLRPGGAQRALWRGQGVLQLLDAADGRALLAQHQVRRGVLAQRAGDARPVDLSILSSSQATGLCAAGPKVLLVESPATDGGTAQDRSFLRDLAGGPPLALGGGFAKSITPDGLWVNMDTGAQAAATLESAWVQAYREAGLGARALEDPKARGRFILFVPTGMGSPFALAVPEGFEPVGNVAHLLPDHQRAVVNLAKGGREAWVLLDRRGAAPRVLSPEGYGIAFASIAPLSPDGSRFVAGNGRDWAILPVEGGAPRPVRGLLPGERVLGWTADGRALFVRPELSVLPVAITRLDPDRGTRTPVLAWTPPDPAGHLQTRGVFMTGDAKAFAFTWEKKLSELYLVEGLR